MIRMHTFSSVCILGMYFLISAGCVSSDSPVLIMYNKAPTSSCQLSATDDGMGISAGFIDANSSWGYFFTPLVKNFAATTDYVTTEQRLAFIEGADITLDTDINTGLGSEYTAFSQRFSAVVEPDGGIAVLGFELIPVEVVQAHRGQLGSSGIAKIRATVTMFGRIAGADFETQDYTYWVEVCDGCLINDLGPCEGLTETPSNTGGACVPLQDTSSVDCCTDGGTYECPASVEPPA